jgi:hypothetical protein
VGKSNKLQLSGVVIPALASIWTEYGLKRISVGCHQDWEDSEIIFLPLPTGRQRCGDETMKKVYGIIILEKSIKFMSLGHVSAYVPQAILYLIDS